MAGTAPAVTATGSGSVPPSMSISSLAYLVPETPTKESAVATGPSPPSSLSSTPPTPPSKGTSPPRPLRRSRAVRRSLLPGMEGMGPTPRVASLTRRSKVSFLSLPQEATLGVLAYITVPDMKSLLMAVAPDRKAFHNLQLHIIATLIERTWSSKSAATVWREVTIECDRYKWHLVHKPQMCPANCRHPEMHMHDKGTELDLARRNWASKYLERPPIYHSEVVQTVNGCDFRFQGTFSESHACRVMHKSEVEFCTTILHDLYESPGEDDAASDRFLVELVASDGVRRMWDAMYANPPDFAFISSVRKLSRLYCLCAHALSINLPREEQWLSLSAIPPIDCKGRVAWEDVWAALAIIAPLARMSINQGDNTGNVSDALASLARPSKLLPMADMPVPSVRISLSCNPAALAPKGPWDWADICGTWYIAMAQFPGGSLKLMSYGCVNLVPRAPDVISDAMAKMDAENGFGFSNPPSYGATLATGLPKSDALPPIYFSGLTQSSSLSRYHLRGIAQLTTDQPPEVRYRVIFRNAETSLDELCFEGVHIGGPGSKRGVVGVAFSLMNNIWYKGLDLDRDNAPPPPPCDTPLAYAAWFWKPEPTGHSLPTSI